MVGGEGPAAVVIQLQRAIRGGQVLHPQHIGAVGVAVAGQELLLGNGVAQVFATHLAEYGALGLVEQRHVVRAGEGDLHIL